MNIFLDTNILYDDPHFRLPSHKILLSFSISGKIQIFISQLVIDELLQLVTERLEEYNSSLVRSNRSINKLMYSRVRPNQINIEYSINQIRSNFDNLNDDSIIKIVPVSHADYKQILYSAVNKLKPFTKKKDGFKDAVIINSYKNYIKEKNLLNCFLITNNLQDFCSVASMKNKNPYSILHPELRQDIDVIDRVYTSVKSLMDDNKESLLIINTPLSKSILDTEYLKEEFDKEVNIPIYLDPIWEFAHDFINQRLKKLFTYPNSVKQIEIQASEIHNVLGVTEIEVEKLNIVYADIDMDLIVDGGSVSGIEPSNNVNYYEQIAIEIMVSVEFSIEIENGHQTIQNYRVRKMTLLRNDSISIE